jgi:hypothetical protein
MSLLFPVPEHRIAHSWTTSTSAAVPEQTARISLTDERALGIHRVWTRARHRLVSPPLLPSSSLCSPGAHHPPPEQAWEACYPAGSVNPSGAIPGGFGFYLSGPTSTPWGPRFADAREVLCAYALMLDDEWEWVRGGKLPGMC